MDKSRIDEEGIVPWDATVAIFSTYQHLKSYRWCVGVVMLMVVQHYPTVAHSVPNGRYSASRACSGRYLALCNGATY